METLILIIITSVAACIQAATGFGFAIIAVPFLLFIMNSVDVIQLVIILTLLTSLTYWPVIKSHSANNVVMVACLGCLAGFPAGIYLYKTFDLEMAKIFIAIFIILIAMINSWHFLSKKQSGIHRAIYMFVGVISGVLATSLAMPGPPMMLLLSRSSFNKDQIRATMAIFFIFSYLGALLMQSYSVGISKEIWLNGLMAAPAVILGIYFGHHLSKKINEQFFKKIILMILFLTGVFMLLNSALIWGRIC